MSDIGPMQDQSPEQEEGAMDFAESPALRPVFLGNLNAGFTSEDIAQIFERPMLPPDVDESLYQPVPVDRVDLKRGFCFVFLKDANSESEKENAEKFVSIINGMRVPNVSPALRVEFARGDGRVKRKEDERRKNIEPSDTLFVVNFHEETTKRSDLQMLFEPFGELVRIDMKRNYAFVQFKTIEQATKAKETTNGGKLDQAVLTVEYVARQRSNSVGRNDRRGDRRGPRGHHRGRRYDRDDRYRVDDRPRRRSRSRSRSPPRHYRDYDRRSPPRYSSRDYDRRSPPRYERSPERDYRGERGYR